MFIKEREYLTKLEMALDKLNTKDYTGAKKDIKCIRDDLKEEIEKFDTWADEESKKEPMIITGLISQGT